MKRLLAKIKNNRLLIVSVFIAFVAGSLSKCITFSDLSQSYDRPLNNAQIACNTMTGDALYSELASLWKSGDKECFLRAIDELQGRKDIETGVRTIREILSDTSAPLSKDDLSRITALNYFIPQVMRGFDGGDVSKYRQYLLDIVVGTTTRAPVRSRAITVLGYYRDDADIELFANIATSDKTNDSELAASVFSLSDSCSAKAREALALVSDSRRLKDYEEKYSQKSALRRLIGECLNR